MEKSFSTVTRLELAKVKFGKEQQLLAELAGFSFSSGNIKLGRGALSLELASENEEIIMRVAAMLKRLYSCFVEIKAVEKNQPKKHISYSIEIMPQNPEGKLLFEIGLLTGSADDYSFGELNKEIFSFEGCFEAMLRGAFLGCGVLCDPQKDYRMEFVLSHDEFAGVLLEKLVENNIQARIAKRKERNVIYINQMENISDVLIFTGAANAMLEFEEVRVQKDVKNNLNRSDNCFFANTGKAINAAQRQIEDINALFEAKVFLTPALKQACDLRLNNPDATLSQLAQISGSTTKSALNKRFIKIHQMSEELKDKS